MKINSLCAASLILALTATSVSVATPDSRYQSKGDTKSRLIQKAREYHDTELEALAETLHSEARNSAIAAQILGITSLALGVVVLALNRRSVSNFLSRCPRIVEKPNWLIRLETGKPLF